MNADSVSAIVLLVILFAFIGVLVSWANKQKGKKEITILEFQCGLKYLSGKFVGKLSPGTYKIFVPQEHIVLVDMRATPITFDRIPATTKDGVTLFVSVSAQIKVVDAATAVASSGNYRWPFSASTWWKITAESDNKSTGFVANS